MHNILFSFLLAFFLPSITHAQGTTYPPLGIGSDAPDFSLPFATRDSIGFGDVTLSGATEKGIVILAFYPADWSGGCTQEVCTFRDNFDSLAGLGVQILAVSGDYIYSHHEWAKYHNLPFTLLSDCRHMVAPEYHSYNQTTGYNKRTVYVIGKGGKIAYVDLEYTTRDLSSFQKLREAVDLLKQKNKD
jgi:peroxiredoxin